MTSLARAATSFFQAEKQPGIDGKAANKVVQKYFIRCKDTTNIAHMVRRTKNA
jgi:hypothetical protein